MISQAQFQSLVTMYRAHSQRIMDSVNKFSFVEIPNLFKHFWRELPNHIFCFIGHKSIVTYIGVCDKILYTTILKAILPTPLQVSKKYVTLLKITVIDNFWYLQCLKTCYFLKWCQYLQLWDPKNNIDINFVTDDKMENLWIVWISRKINEWMYFLKNFKANLGNSWEDELSQCSAKPVQDARD